MDKIRRHYVFFGYVQGVGFRYNAMYLAKNLKLTGWVRNERDGSVTLEAQGEPQALDELIRELKERRYIRIMRITEEEIPVIPENDFTVRY